MRGGRWRRTARARAGAAAPVRHFCFFLVNGVGSVGDRGTKRLALPLAGMDDLADTSRVEKKARHRGHCIVSAGLLWKLSAGCRTGEAELPKRKSGANW